MCTVVLLSTDTDCEFSLEDENGKFLTVPTTLPECEGSESPVDYKEEQARGRWTRERRMKRYKSKFPVRLQQKLKEEKERFRWLWYTNCKCLAKYTILWSQPKRVKSQNWSIIYESSCGLPHPCPIPHCIPPTFWRRWLSQRRASAYYSSTEPPRKASPIDPFNGEDLEIHLEDWLPSLERDRIWNDWTEDQLMLQLAGHLKPFKSGVYWLGHQEGILYRSLEITSPLR